MVPNGSLNGSPPANGFPPGALWHAAQSAARARYSPRATNSGVGTMSAADTSGSRSIRRHKMTEPTITTTDSAATPMILSHLDPIIFTASPVEQSMKFNLSSGRSPGGRGSHPKSTAFLYPETQGLPAGDSSRPDFDRLPRLRSRRVRGLRASQKQRPEVWFF